MKVLWSRDYLTPAGPAGVDLQDLQGSTCRSCRGRPAGQGSGFPHLGSVRPGMSATYDCLYLFFDNDGGLEIYTQTHTSIDIFFSQLTSLCFCAFQAIVDILIITTQSCQVVLTKDDGITFIPVLSSDAGLTEPSCHHSLNKRKTCLFVWCGFCRVPLPTVWSPFWRGGERLWMDSPPLATLLLNRTPNAEFTSVNQRTAPSKVHFKLPVV